MKKMLTSSILTLVLGIIFTAAMAVSRTYPPLDTVTFQLSAEQWASSATAKVIVGINATLDDAQLATINNTIMANLQKIDGSADWHITQFTRSKNQSGLEQLSAQAEARLPINALSNLRQNAASVSKPGAVYSIDVIDFSPSAREIEKVRADLRSQIYVGVQQELARLNKVYSDEKFYLYSIDFGGVTPGPIHPVQATMFVAESNAAPAAAMAVSRKIEMDADVVLASTYTSQ